MIRLPIPTQGYFEMNVFTRRRSDLGVRYQLTGDNTWENDPLRITYIE